MNKVFVVQEPLKRDRDTGEMRSFMNLTPAAIYGAIQPPLLTHNNITLSPAPMIAALKNGLKDFTKNDSLLLIGDPVAIAMAAIIGAKQAGGSLKVLKWNRDTASYIQLTMEV